MKKLLSFAVAMALVFALLISGCGLLNGLPSTCDDQRPSVLCEKAKENGFRLENVALGLIAANAIMINQDEWTAEQAVVVLKEMREIFDNPVSYAFAKSGIEKAANKFPGMIDIADEFIGSFSGTKIMYKKDQEIMIEFLDNRIKSLI